MRKEVSPRFGASAPRCARPGSPTWWVMTDAAESLSDDRVLGSGSANVTSWTDAVRDRKIESRNLVTDDAIIGVVAELQPRTVLDLGCGEGWLARRLAETGV